MEEEKVNINYNLISSFPPPVVVDSDLDFSFTSTASTSTFASTSTSSARSSLSLSLPSFSPSTSLISSLPHSSSHNSPLWSALRAASTLSKDGSLHLRHLHLLRHLGSGHLAKVFHCRLKGSDSFDFALKVVDLNTLHPSSSSDHQQHDTRLSHVRTEARVLAALDHPFLPTLYARMDASHYACFLIDYCPGGDLHSLLLRHPGHRLPVSAVRFFAAEVLLALEYLHALGFVYRDLKPENILIRSDGHIMLSDFDLCFSSEVKPSLYRRRSRLRRRRRSSSSCFGGDQSGRDEDQEELMEFVAEPEAAFSRACVGTHEYLAPEIVSGSGHGNGVDWWAFGVFVYELMYGRTPFKGSTKEATLKNIMKKGQAVRFPDYPVGPTDQSASAAARDLIRRLLVQEPKERLGSRRGAAEIKRHPFFEGVKWPLIRSTKSPVVVGPAGAVVVKEGKRGWWRRVNSKWRNVVCYKKGIKLGLGSSTSSSNSSNNKRKGIRKEKSSK